MFCSLLRECDGEADYGFMAVDLLDFTHAEQEYLTNTAILVTRLHDRHGFPCISDVGEIKDWLDRLATEKQLSMLPVPCNKLILQA